MKLSADQIEIIEARVDENNITIGTLRDDLIDHLCCVVEGKLTQDVPFEKAIKDAMRELAPNGLHELEEETVFLLNSQKIIRMKKFKYLIGLLSAMSMSIGLWFKFMRWPGADELMSYGFLSFTLLYLPMMLVDHLKMKIQSALSERLRLILGLASA